MFKIKNKDSRAMTSFCCRADRDSWHGFLGNIFLLRVNNNNSKIKCEIFIVDNVDKKDIRPRSMTSFWCLYYYLWTYSPPCSSVSIEVFEQVFVCSVWTFLYFNRFYIWWFQVSSIFTKDFHKVEYFQKSNAPGAYLKQWNGRCISIKFLLWNLNYELTALIINELHTFL